MKSKEELLEEAKNRLSLLDAQIGELRMQEESRAKLKRTEDALADISSIRASVESMRADFDRASRETERLWGEIQKRDFAVPERVEAKLTEHDAAIKGLSKKVTGEKEMLAAYRNSVANLLKEIGAIKQEDFETLKKSLDERLVRLPELEAKIEGVAGELHNLAGLEARLKDIDSEAKRVALDFERRMESVGRIALELEKIKAGIAVEISRIPFFDTKLSGISGELEKLKNVDFTKSTDELREEIKNALHTNKKETEQMRAYVDNAVSGMEAKINELSVPGSMRAKLIEHDAVIKELGKKVTGEKDLLATYRASMANMLKEAGAVKKEDFETLKKSFEDMLAKLPELETKIKEITVGPQGMEELRARVEDINSVINKIVPEFEKVKLGTSAEPSKFQALDAKINEISGELKKLEKADFAGDIGELKSYLDKIEKEIKKEIRGIKQESEDNKKELEQMKAHVNKELQNLRADGAEKAAKSAVENLMRERQSIFATLKTIKSGYEEKLISEEDYEEIVRDNERKIAEIDTRIAEMSK